MGAVRRSVVLWEGLGAWGNVCRVLHWVVALASSEANPGPTGAGTGTIFRPRAPGAILRHLVDILPHAVTFIAPL